MKPDVLYLDNHLLVVLKPAGYLAQADETGDPDVVNWGKAFLKKEFAKPGRVYLGLVHRLDRPASGIMVLARTSKAAARLASQFRKHSISKKYLAIVEGSLRGNDVWEDHLLKEGRRGRVVGTHHPKAKRARLSWTTIGHQQGTSLVDIGLITGRHHQIRVQFAARGYPLLGDFRYGSERPFDHVNLALHNYLLMLQHPVQKRPMAWTAPAPQTWSRWYEPERETLMKAIQAQIGDFFKE